MKKLLAKIRKILRDRRTRQMLTRIISVTAAIVVFITTYALVLPAITMELEAKCGIPAHQHDDSCYEEVLVCELEETDGHHHDESCYNDEGELICEIPESDGHQHDSSCYEKVLTCGKEVHIHSAACYENTSSGATVNAEDVAVEISSGAASTGAAAASNTAATAVSTGTSSVADTISAENDDNGSIENADTIENAGTAATEDVATSLTTVDNAEAGVTADGHYVPKLNPVVFTTVLDNHTGIYYHTVADGETVEDSTQIGFDGWNRVDNHTELGKADLLRVYLAYSIPAGALNPTNPVARYRLPSNLHLADAQVNAINNTVNGIAGGYVNMDTLEILDIEKYYAYLGIEAVEGTRTPDQDVNDYLAEQVKRGKEGQEYISATVRAENIYDEHSSELVAQDLVFTWTPYSIEKNQHEYDSAGQPTKVGEEISGWLTLDFNMGQVDFPDTDVTTFERIVEDQTVDAEKERETDKPVDESGAVDDDSVEDHSVVIDVEDTGKNTTAVETVEHREQTADVVFVKEGRDENNQKIHEISTTLTVVEESVINTHDVHDRSEEQENTEAINNTADDGETVEKTEDAVTDDAEDQYQSGTLTAEGDGYAITLTYTADAKIPADAILNVAEITEESDPEAYEACLAQARQSINADNAGEADDSTTVDKLASRFFDIEIQMIVSDGDGEERTAKIEPTAPVAISIQLEEAETAFGSASEKATVNDEKASQEPTVLHFAEGGVEKIESSTVESVAQDNEEASENSMEIQFEASAFSIYGVVYTTLATTVLTASGETYEITVRYGEDAGIPEGAKLRVHEISEEEEEYQKVRRLIKTTASTPGYSLDAVDEADEVSDENVAYEDTDSEDYNSGEEAPGTDDAIDSTGDGVESMLAFDISIYDSEGNIIEPENPVSVAIKLLSLPDGVDVELLRETMEVHHIVKEDGEEKAVLVADTGVASEGKVIVDEIETTAEFITRSFSVYTISWGTGSNQQLRLHFVDESGNDLTIDHSVVFNGNTVNGNTVNISGGNVGIFDGDGKLDLSQFQIDGYTLSSTHKGTWEDLFEDKEYNLNQNKQSPHTIIGNTIKVEGGQLKYQLFYTNSDKAGSGWYPIGKRPQRDEYNSAWGHGSDVSDGADKKGIYDYYLVYSTTPGSAAGNSQQEAPDLDDVSGAKKKIDNGDGTYNLELSVSTPGDDQEKANSVNVIIVFDTSSSMQRKPEGGDPKYNDYQTNSATRFYQAATAVETFVKELAANNTSDNPYAVEMALVSFNYSANLVQGWTNSGTTIINKLWKMTCATGTNWADGLNVADSMSAPVIAAAPDRKADTYVLLVTDGAPSQYWYGPGSTITGNNTFFVDGEGSYLAARDEARRVVRNGKILYGLFAFGSTISQSGNNSDEYRDYIGKLTSYAYNNDVTGSSHSYFAQDSTTLSNQLSEILEDIFKTFAYSSVQITDGLTSLETTALTSGVATNFVYKIAKYEENEIVSGSEASVVKNGNNIIVTFPDGETDTIPQASYNSSSNQVTWPLGEEYNLRPGYTYTVSFTVWPSQQTYDYIADLMNGIAVWTNNGDGTATISYPDNSKPAIITSEIVKSGNSYSLKTNKKDGNGVSYYFTEKMPVALLPQDVTIPSGQNSVTITDESTGVITVYTKSGTIFTKTTKTPGTLDYTNPDPMPLSDNHMKVQKEWVVSRPEELVAFLYNTSNGTRIPENENIDFDILQDTAEDPYTSVTLGYDEAAGEFAWVGTTQTVTVKDENGNDITYAVGTKWEKQLDISIGLMITPDKAQEHSIDVDNDLRVRPVYAEDDEDRETALYYVLEVGHDYTIDEPQLDYRFDFKTNVYHPMLVNNVIKDVEIEYKQEGGRYIGILKGITPDGEHLSALTGQNVLRGELKMKKIVLDAAGNEDNSDEATAKVFPLTITLTNDPGDGSTGPFYNIDGDAAEQNIPWYGIQTENDETTLYYHKLDSEGNFLYYCNEHEACIEGDFTNGVNEAAGYRGNMMEASDDCITATATIYVKPKETWTITNIPGGTNYTITETQIEGYEFIKAEELQSDPENKVEKPAAASIDGVIEANKITNVEFTNKIKPPVFIKKVSSDNSSITADGAEFDLYREFEKQTPTEEEVQNNGLILKFGKYLQKVNSSKIISGSYMMQKEPEQEEPEEPGGDSPEPVVEEPEEEGVDLTLHGYALINHLVTSDVYYLVETKAPDGYNSPIFEYIKLWFGIVPDPGDDSKTAAVLNWLSFVEVIDGENISYQQTGTAGRAFADTVPVTVDGSTALDAYTVTVVNNPGAELPSTGGPGTKLIYLAGALLTLFGAVMLMGKKIRA